MEGRWREREREREREGEREKVTKWSHLIEVECCVRILAAD